MKIISKRAFLFLDEEIVQVKNKTTGESEATCNIRNSFKVSPSSFPQHCPDWIQTTDLFKLAVGDGNLKVVQ